ncbi:hypothetical protein LguiA_016052 [Lonicera macranthoides]
MYSFTGFTSNMWICVFGPQLFIDTSFISISVSNCRIAFTFLGFTTSNMWTTFYVLPLFCSLYPALFSLDMDIVMWPGGSIPFYPIAIFFC